ncbi:hypothetical protein SOVF_154490 [Spinacia oleracea]|uniref:Agamous-like MADS-box protein AGL61 n=1 Tax=Spinacia oleracea TaxID=3562 RepID=A0A9R0JEN7_SPIOL|nr:agamous-like MADS-box protein AGL61 [Spinacia oleracea]KNA09352.1 hypothetical protein SOVF_154490 [Spinacia oleracea]
MAKENEVKTKPLGKRKIPIEKIENKARKQVTFSKRRKGIFKKASELCTLCGAKIAVLTFSGAGKIFTFGDPSADEVINTWHANRSPPPSWWSDDAPSERVEYERMKMNDTTTYSDDDKDKDLFWWQKDIEGLGFNELVEYMASLKELRNNVASKIGDCLGKNVDVSSRNNQDGLDLNMAYNPTNNEGEDTMNFPISFKPKSN